MTFPDKVVLTPEHEEVLNSSQSLVVTGAAGTGKTLLAVLIAKNRFERSSEQRGLIVVSTNSLRDYLESALARFQISNVEVTNGYGYGTMEVDYVIIDEAQDFSLDIILSIAKLAKRATYVFIDDGQQVYDKCLIDKKPCCTAESIIDRSGFNTVKLKSNLRFGRDMAAKLDKIFADTTFFKNSLSDGGSLRFIKVSSREAQIEKIAELIKNELFGSTCILFSDNYSIADVYHRLMQLGVENIGYKNSADSANLCFAENSTNLLTLHSAKGTEFQNVIFLNCAHEFPNPLEFDRIKRNAIYVAMTRAREKLIFLYSVKLNMEGRQGLASCFKGINVGEKNVTCDKVEEIVAVCRNYLYERNKISVNEALNKAAQKFHEIGCTPAETLVFAEDFKRIRLSLHKRAGLI